jgi:hypothetical protein
MNIKKTDMEEKINKAAILKDKPKGTKLYTILSDGECFLNEASEDSIYIDIDNRERFWCLSAYGSTHSFPNGCVLLFPSREMRDWSKFAWKKGDVLINSCGFQCIFKEWASDDYTKFNGCYSNSRDGYEDVLNAETAKFDKLDNNTAYGYIREIENRCGGKLNLETLEIKKPEFKDGDIVTIMPHIGDKLIYLFKAEDDEKYYGHVFLDGNIAIVNEDSYCQKDFCTARSSTEEEKQQLFEALAKKGKAWDAEKKQIVDIKKELQFKPFEKVLVRDSYNDMWRASFFSHIKEDDGRYVTTCCTWKFCIPYIGNESLVGTTKDVEG